MKPSRPLYAVVVFIVVALGLLVRARQDWFPEVVNLYLGDALYAVMMFFIFSFLFPDKKAEVKALYALVLCWCIELLQLYNAPWINAVRATLPGRLILGQGFLCSDLLAYAMGVTVAYCVDKLWHPARKISG